jgi:hypothetical protein
MRPHGLIAAALVAAVFAVYAQVRSHEFVDFDDPVYLSTIRRGFCSEEIVGAWTEATAANWIPVTVTSLLLDRELYGDAPAGYLLTNTALHAASTALLFLTFAAATGSVWPSAFVAATFGLHPLHVESVAWFSQRKDVLCALFWILTLAAHLHYARRPSAARYALVLLGAVLGLLSKPMMVTVPFTLLLLDYWPLRRLQLGKPRSLGRPAIEKLPLLALALAVGAVTYSVQDAAGAIAPEDAIPLGARIANAIESYVAYLWNAVWPVHLAAYSKHPRAGLTAGADGGALRGRATLRTRRLALVPGHAGARHRNRAGGTTGPGRPLHLRAADRRGDHRGLACGRPRTARSASAARRRRRRRRLDRGDDRRLVATGEALEEFDRPIRARRRRHAIERDRPRRPGPRPAQ